MKNKLLLGLGTVGCLALGVFWASAQDDGPAVPNHQLSEFKLGAHVSGEEVDLSNLEGQAVAIEYWGTR